MKIGGHDFLFVTSSFAPGDTCGGRNGARDRLGGASADVMERPHQATCCCTGVIFPRQRPVRRDEIRFPSERSRGAQPSMATKTGKDLEDLRALLTEVLALREDVETKGAELRREWGPAAERANSRATNLSHYIALRSHDLNDLQLRLAARGLSSLGRSEAKVCGDARRADRDAAAADRRDRPYPIRPPQLCARERLGARSRGRPPVRQARRGARRACG